MPRPRKWRRVCTMPPYTNFGPQNNRHMNPVNMTVDEYETIRLIDAEGFTQEQCADQMEIARTTVQAIYAGARKKLAACIVNGRPLVIGGGEYRICGHEDGRCGHGCCHRHCNRQHPNGLANGGEGSRPATQQDLPADMPSVQGHGENKKGEQP